jgi:hypothetical protein
LIIFVYFLEEKEHKKFINACHKAFTRQTGFCPLNVPDLTFWLDGRLLYFRAHLNFFFSQFWGLNSEPTPWVTSPVLFYAEFFPNRGSRNFLPGLASNHNAPDSCLLNSKDYRCEPPVQKSILLSHLKFSYLCVILHLLISSDHYTYIHRSMYSPVCICLSYSCIFIRNEIHNE